MALRSQVYRDTQREICCTEGGRQGWADGVEGQRIGEERKGGQGAQLWEDKRMEPDGRKRRVNTYVGSESGTDWYRREGARDGKRRLGAVS